MITFKQFLSEKDEDPIYVALSSLRKLITMASFFEA